MSIGHKRWHTFLGKVPKHNAFPSQGLATALSCKICNFSKKISEFTAYCAHTAQCVDVPLEVLTRHLFCYFTAKSLNIYSTTCIYLLNAIWVPRVTLALHSTTSGGDWLRCCKGISLGHSLFTRAAPIVKHPVGREKVLDTFILVLVSNKQQWHNHLTLVLLAGLLW